MSGKFLFSRLLPVIHEQRGNKFLDDMCGNQGNVSETICTMQKKLHDK